MTPTNNEIAQLIARKISIVSEKTKVWIQRETKNVLQSIETTKKRLVKEILCSTKSICTRIIEAIEPTLDPAKISNIEFNSKAANHEESKKIAFISPVSHSSPNIKCNQISIIQSPQSKSKIQSNISHLLEITPKVSKSMLTSFINSNVPKIVESKCNQRLQELMSIDTKPSHELQIKVFNEQIKNHNELKIEVKNNNELHRNNPFNKDQIPRLYSKSNLSKIYESDQNYPGNRTFCTKKDISKILLIMKLIAPEDQDFTIFIDKLDLVNQSIMIEYNHAKDSAINAFQDSLDRMEDEKYNSILKPQITLCDSLVYEKGYFSLPVI